MMIVKIILHGEIAMDGNKNAEASAIFQTVSRGASKDDWLLLPMPLLRLLHKN
jgi:hypothetical protein